MACAPENCQRRQHRQHAPGQRAVKILKLKRNSISTFRRRETACVPCVLIPTSIRPASVGVEMESSGTCRAGREFAPAGTSAPAPRSSRTSSARRYNVWVTGARVAAQVSPAFPARSTHPWCAAPLRRSVPAKRGGANALQRN